MSILDWIDVSEKDRLYWEQLIGQECLAGVLRSQESFECMKDEFESEARYSAERFYSFLIHRGAAQRKTEGVQEGLFEAFFDYWRDYAAQSLMKVEMAILSPALTEKIAGQMTEKIAWAGMRCLIDEMGRLKTEGRLYGQDSAEEYADYLETYLEDPRYIEKILEKYPVLTITPSDNIPVFDTRKVDYKGYADVVIKGFEKAYSCILNNKQVFIELVQNSIPVKNCSQ